MVRVQQCKVSLVLQYRAGFYAQVQREFKAQVAEQVAEKFKLKEPPIENLDKFWLSRYAIFSGYPQVVPQDSKLHQR